MVYLLIRKETNPALTRSAGEKVAQAHLSGHTVLKGKGGQAHKPRMGMCAKKSKERQRVATGDFA
jgi:hypothetical protein